ncbi:ribosome maturation factor RimP [Desulfosediminicola flagellatus]|uniref:ribosome maturation factor RimP n=1 Tax=Desulfosediminicola flagellatus TaxID=2569541 RepID=UPI0010ACD303|nr:ribosome maturation factor RimP [Desulfosediminicola flagellatus]
MSEFVIEKIEEFAATLLPAMGLELVEVQFRREGHGWVLRVFIDAVDGITVEHCADVSREVSVFLDVEELIDHPFNLEVSSPGVERALNTLADFERHIGKKSRIRMRETVDGQKVFVGIIHQADEEAVELLLEDESVVRLPVEFIRKARLSL